MSRPGPPPVWDTPVFGQLKSFAESINKDGPKLKQLLQDEGRNAEMQAEFDGILLDYSRQQLTKESRDALLKGLPQAANLKVQIDAMAAGKFINTSEGRAVLHMALRAPKGEAIMCAGKDVVPDVHQVLDRIYEFSDKVRSGVHLGATGKKITSVISVGIGGSYLGPEFVLEALRCDSTAAAAAVGRQVHFLANVDPVGVKRALDGFDAETTMVVIVSKTFTTAETMLNARTVKHWLLKQAEKTGADKKEMIRKHMIAVSANVPSAEAFGIDASNVFGFWDWVGGRYSVCSAVGAVPLALQYGKDVVQQFLAGAHSMDKHFLNTPFDQNLPALLGLIGVWNSTFLGHGVRALLPYAEGLLRFPAHIQQVDMESNGKRVSKTGVALPFEAGEVNFGEPGTNGQHSFYQLIHQGRVVPCDFIGSVVNQHPIDFTSDGEPVSNHDELMSNFFAQPDALAVGKSPEELKAEGVPESLWADKTFPGNRPSTSILFPCFDAKRIGQLLALYEHRSAVQGFVWGINSFDQWGVELGKVLAKQVRQQLHDSRQKGAQVSGFNSSTSSMLKKYLAGN
uniref:Glucose-6-phosphate isomerase n=1 Tax=Mucochytrium quahogii TaxID=96639 RepID=A0A7S2S165_9STRA|mmetsp:Transcript_2309/g.4730  ORF Transcript_2309/g.4730 Transcript_2309/m.4730 type:complete len:568 (+) Transcript_2309:134-1837(+)